jgi:hypothetical protein
MGGKFSTHGEMKNAYNISDGTPERKTSLRRPNQRWKNNIKMCLNKECVRV